MRAAEIARIAADLVDGDRDRVHGAKPKNFGDIASLWNGYLRRRFPEMQSDLTATDAALMGVLLKVARTLTGEHNIDDYTDACGYSACAGEIACIEKSEVPNGIS